jgi:uncharacterized protein YqjF (DUF2071 family)
MLQRWERLTFLHWRYDPDDIQRRLPAGLAVDPWDGWAWVGMTPFLLKHLRPPFAPPLPWLSTFLETNLRTYVTSRAGEPGIWFFSLDAERLAAVAAAQLTYGLPYKWSKMSFEHKGRLIRYTGSRRWPSPVGVGYAVTVETGAPIPPSELKDFDHFLTARWRLYTTHAGKLLHADVEHPPWPLARARVTRLEQSLTHAAGLPEPSGDPLVHFSPGVDTRIGPLRRNAPVIMGSQ